MASSLLMMSFAAGLHELSHLDDARGAGCCAHAETPEDHAGGDRFALRQGCPAELQGVENGFCFFCTSPATMSTVATGTSPSELLSHSIAHRSIDTDPPQQRIFDYSSPRPPPFIG